MSRICQHIFSFFPIYFYNNSVRVVLFLLIFHILYYIQSIYHRIDQPGEKGTPLDDPLYAHLGHALR